MAFDVMDEHEQGEQVQKWLRENALWILVGIGLGLVLLYGWQQWRKHALVHRMDAAVQYDALVADIDKKEPDAAKAIAATLRSDYPGTPYAVFGVMRDAQIAADKGDAQAARDALDWAWRHADNPALQAVVGVNLARVQIAQSHAQDALDLLDKLPKGGFEAMRAELRGDALAALGRKAEARAAYADALARLDPGAPDRNFIEMKLTDLAADDAAAVKTDTDKKSS